LINPPWGHLRKDINATTSSMIMIAVNPAEVGGLESLGVTRTTPAPRQEEFGRAFRDLAAKRRAQGV
jgi:hypothetical protein